MSTQAKITKEIILQAAFEIARVNGLEKVSNREIAKKINCSIRPIYYYFKNTEELNKELYKKIEKYFYKVIMEKVSDDIPPYKQIGINYIKFARNEKKLFQILFTTGNKNYFEDFIANDLEDYEKLTKIIKNTTKLSDEDISTFHIRMWIFSHGIATLVANDTISLTEEQVRKLLSDEFQALMLLEENKDNKWALKDKGEKI